MNENEFREQYARLQERIAPSPELDRKTAARVRAALKRGADPATAPRAAAGGFRRWAAPAAACLVVAALVAGAVPVVTASLDQGGPDGIGMPDATAASGFAVRAYASDGSTPLTLGQDGVIAFDRDTSTGLYDSSYYQTEGYFTGCLFRIEGEGIARVQMNVSRGTLYSQVAERFTRREEPEKWAEALSWKPTKRGTGTFGDYDSVVPISEGDSLPKDSPDKRVGVNLAKLLGSTVDVSAEGLPQLASGDVSFGLWTNDPYPEEANPFNAVVDLFDGQTLTVTVTFDDGRASTQVIELHAAGIKISHDGGESKLVPEINEEEGALHSLYGTVISANKEAFPLPLDGANDRAGELLPALVLERNAETRATGQELGEGDLVGEGVDIDAAASDGRDGTVPITMGYPVVTRSACPPDGTLPEEFAAAVHGFNGGLAYVDKCSREVFGYGFNEDGSLTSDEFTYVTATFDVTNAGDNAVQVRQNALAEFGILDEEGNLFILSTSYDLDFSASGNAVPAGDPQCIGIAPGDTVRVSLLRVLPVRLAEADSLILVPVNAADGTVAQAFDIGGQP